MNRSQQVYLIMSTDIRALLHDNNTDVAELLRTEGIDAEIGIASAPVEDTLLSSKEPMSVLILSGAAVVASLTPLITKVLNQLSRRETRTTLVMAFPTPQLSDDADTRPSLANTIQWIPFEPSTATPSRTSEHMSFKVTTPLIGFEIEFKTEEER